MSSELLPKMDFFFDNNITRGGSDVGGQLVHEDGEVVPLSVIDNNDGTLLRKLPVLAILKPNW